MRYIEKNFPIKYLNPVAMAEGNAKKPVYQIHKWWARRLSSVFRMIVLSTFSEENAKEEDIWQKFLGDTNLGGPIILDPFMGGGTTIVEALRLGCRVIGIDINPVAWFITKKEIEPVDLEELDLALKELEKSAGRFIKQFYQTKCPKGHPSEVMYFFWVKIAQCPNCNRPVWLFNNYELSERNGKVIVICPNCLDVFETPSSINPKKCPNCGYIFDSREGVSQKGVYLCPYCGSKERVIDVIQRKGGPLDAVLYALEGYCEICGRFFKKVDREDIKLWEEAKNKFMKEKGNLLLPPQQIPAEGRSDPRPLNHGYTRFQDLFNERQLLCLSYLLERILDIPNKNIREFMLLAFSDCLDSNNMFCKYESRWNKISLFFGLHAYHPIERPTENNPWGGKYGRGTFLKCFEKLRRGKEYCKKVGPIEGLIVESFEELLKTERSALLRCQTGEDLSFIPDKSVDTVITDPPYFDNIQYSELADFFYVWLHLGLRDFYPWFNPANSSHPQEIVQNEKIGKTLEFFREGLTRVFSECHRVLKDDGLLIFTFHHNKLWAWETIGRILLDSGFYISSTPIVRSEGKSGFHSGRGNIRYDCVFVCRKRPSNWKETGWSTLKDAILKDAVHWANKTIQSGMTLNEVDLFTIIMGKTIEYYTKAFPHIKKYNEPITIAEALNEMKEFAACMFEATHPDKFLLPKSVAKKAQQLSLFLKESGEQYHKK